MKIDRIALLSQDGGTSIPTFCFGDQVKIDKGDVAGTVIGIAVYPHGGLMFQVSWWHNGSLNDQWIAEWRLTKALRP